MKTATKRTVFALSTTRARLYVELSGEDGTGPWTVLAVDRATRRYAVAQAESKTAATHGAARALTELLDR